MKQTEKEENAVIEAALQILRRRNARGVAFTSPQSIKDYLTIQCTSYEFEVFGMVFLDSQHRMLGIEEMFFGTLAQTSVYPREVVKKALEYNAGACILFHNHPSGVCEPSRADEMLTKTLKDSLAMIDCRVLDHIVVGGGNCMSFAERGLI